jgi:hypothetical protein
MRAPPIAITALLAFRLAAHEGPEHEIEELTQRMARQGESADLLLERAIEYRTLGRWSEAANDLQRAVRLEPRDPLLFRELAQTQLRDGRTADALVTLRQALRLPSLSPQERAAILLIRGQAHASGDSPAAALRDCDEALRADPTLVSGYLDRSALQKRLKRSRERLAGLDEGIRHTGAGILVAERVEAESPRGHPRGVGDRPAPGCLEDPPGPGAGGPWAQRRGGDRSPGSDRRDRPPDAPGRTRRLTVVGPRAGAGVAWRIRTSSPGLFGGGRTGCRGGGRDRLAPTTGGGCAEGQRSPGSQG